MSNPALEAAVDDLRRQIGDHVAELKLHPSMSELLRLQAALNPLEDLLAQPRTSLASFFGVLDATTGSATLSANSSAGSRVRFDEFFGVEQLDAAKRYLKKCTNARPFPEILDAVKAGGGKVESENDLRTGLSRSTLDVVKIGDSYGLLEHYPHIKRGGKKKKNAVGNGDAQGAVAAVSEKQEEESKAVSE